MIKTILHETTRYPAFQAAGFAAKFAFPFAREVCRGYGCDVGCNRPEWAFTDIDGVPALQVDPALGEYDAMNLPPGHFDYIFSSHCAEHLSNWVDALDYWQTRIKRAGVLFLYLPHPTQTYWLPWNNRKHVHVFTPVLIRDYLTARGWENIFVSGVDLNNSFCVMAQKA